MYLEEGQAEGVRGDIAFVQSIIETGWFSFGGRVPPDANNFSGLGATDGTSSYATFADARTGVRAQIQHLRAYADATATSCTQPPLHNDCVDPRFNLVSAEGQGADLEPVRQRRVGHRPGLLVQDPRALRHAARTTRQAASPDIDVR